MEEFARHIKMRHVSLDCTATKFTRDEFHSCTSYSVTSPSGERRECFVLPVFLWISKLGDPKPRSVLSGPAPPGGTDLTAVLPGSSFPNGYEVLSGRQAPICRRTDSSRRLWCMKQPIFRLLSRPSCTRISTLYQRLFRLLGLYLCNPQARRLKKI